MQTLFVDLSRPPEDRWKLNAEQVHQAHELLRSYKTDLGLQTNVASFLIEAAKEFVSPEHWSEMAALAGSLNVPIDDVVLGNFYYDALKVVLGCTAFAVETANGILHARNLDWWTESEALARYSCICRFNGGPAGPFTTIGWPGFTGVFSGIAPGRFAVTLNAVLSFDPPQPAMPVVLLLRTVLETATSFNEALDLLCTAPIPCECLLLLSGVQSGEIAVIERTPTRHAVRNSESGFICVTNDYKLLSANPDGPKTQLQVTSCRRFDRVHELFRLQRPSSPDACLSWLDDPGVRMNITVQQMVFNAGTDDIRLEIPRSR